MRNKLHNYSLPFLNIDYKTLYGSWAGAFGYFQFMPSTITNYAIDYNNDGYEDLVVVCNIYNTEVETPRLDNPYGLILVSNKKDGYSVIGPKESGFYLKGNAKSVETISIKDKNFIIVGVNNGEVEVYEY